MVEKTREYSHHLTEIERFCQGRMMKPTHKKDIKKLAQDPDCIPGIYNYCDRWCERCPFTSRCMTFKLSEEKFGDPETQDDALTLLKEMAEEKGIDLDSIAAELDEKDRFYDEDNTVVHMLLHMSKSYIAMADQWFEPYEDLAKHWGDEKVLDPADDPSLAPSEEETMAFKDAVEVVRWYQFQIHVKLKRALNSAHEEKTEDIDDFPKDSDGSAKVALIGIDRSMSAWGKILKVFPDQEEESLSIITYLKRLSDRAENEFPEARSFKRPGFDEAAEGS
jgi:hypothetical protein